MCEASTRFTLITFVLASLVINGLVSEGDVGRAKPLTVEAASNKTLLQDAKFNTVTLSKPNSDVTNVTDSAKVSIEEPSNVTQSTNNTKVNEAKIVDGRSDDSSAQPGKEESTKKDDTNVSNETSGKSSTPTVVSTTETSTTVVTGAIEEGKSSTTESTNISTETTSEMTTSTEVSSTTPSTILPEGSQTVSTTITSVISSTLSSTTSEKLTSTSVPTDGSTTTEVPPQQSEVVEKKPDPGMSSGIIALVMAIVFAVVVIIVYVGLLLWRRYLEYKYGNRELLVNDLEFDTNDLRHFEL